MTDKLTDDAVSRLDLHDGRVELLNEILETPTVGRFDGPRTRRLPTSLTVGVAAAAVLVAAVGVPVWVAQRSDDGPTQVPVQAPPAAQGNLAVLDARGWTATSAYVEKDSGELDYTKGEQTIGIAWYAADTHPSYVEDRQLIRYPEKDPGEQLTVLGRDALLWPYNRKDHTVIREPQGGVFVEVRGSGMGKADFLALLEQLRSVDVAGLEASLPDEFVTGDDRPEAVREILAAMGTELPPGYDGPPLGSEQPDRYQLGAEIAGGMACSWLDEFAAAKQSGDQARIDAAVAALLESKDWPILHEMNSEGDYPEVVWEYADEAAAGRVPEGYGDGLGCAGPSVLTETYR